MYIVCGKYVLTMNAELEVIENGAVAVEGKKIVAVGGKDKILADYPQAEILGGDNHVVMPGLINTHGHAAMVYLRGFADDLPLKDWLEQHIWPAEGKWLSPEFVYDGTELACLEMLRSGTTTFTDMYFYGDSIARAAKAVGMRALIGEAIFDFPSVVGKDAAAQLQHAEEFICQWQHDELITPVASPHSAYVCSPKTLQLTLARAEKYSIPLQIHISETAWENGEIEKKYGKTPTAHLHELGLLNDKTIAAHCVWTDAQDIEILAKQKVGVAHCIESNLKLASGFAPIPQMLQAGVKVALGTDGAASNNDLDLLSEMTTVGTTHKAVHKDSTVVDAKKVVAIATRGGADVIGRPDLGRLEAGCLADIITLDLHKPHLLPIYNIYSHIVYAAKGSDVDNVMVNGQMVMRDRQVAGVDEEAVLVKAQEWGEKIMVNDKW